MRALKLFFIALSIALPIALLTTACGGSDDPQAQRLESHIADATIDCGDLFLGINECPAGREEAVACMANALFTCERAMLVQRYTSIEGDPLIEYLFVVPVTDGCAITRFWDARADGFGSMTIEESTCAEVVINDAPDCPYPMANGCQ